MIGAYQYLLSSVLGGMVGGGCRFYPSCSEYSKGSFEKYSVGKAFWLSVKRLLKCHPFHPGGIDYP